MKTTVSIREQKDGRLVADYRYTCDRASRGYYAEDYESYDASYTVENLNTPTVGDVYMVGTSEYVGPNGEKNPHLLFWDDNGEGWPGNSDHNIKRYHGWRGTSDDWAFYGMGVRRCLAIRKTGNRSRRVVIVFGRDLKRGED